MYKVDIVYICQMDFNNPRSYREIICPGKPGQLFLLANWPLIGTHLTSWTKNNNSSNARFFVIPCKYSNVAFLQRDPAYISL